MLCSVQKIFTRVRSVAKMVICQQLQDFRKKMMAANHPHRDTKHRQMILTMMMMIKKGTMDT